MSLIKRILGKNPPATPVASAPEPAPPPKPRPDTAARAREEQASIEQAIASGDTVALGKWVLEGSSTQTRQLAAHAVTDPEHIRELIRATRGGNDKNVYRILTGKRDALLTVERTQQQQQAEVEATSAAIARHSERAFDALYEATLTQLDIRWQAASAHASPELQGEVTQQLARAHEVLEQHRAEIEADKERKRAAAQAALEARQQRELENQAAAEAAATSAAEAEAASRAREETRAQAREAERAEHEAVDAEVREMLGLLRQAQAAIDHGGTARAAKLRDTIKEKLPQSPALPHWFARRLEDVDGRIEEMKDWKTFTVVPKRHDLVQRAHGLVGADIAPEELARQIRRLRDEWKTLNRGAAEDPSPEWQDFDAALTRAYEPCRVHFAQQSELRKQNQANRELLLERLAAFTEKQQGGDADWRLVQQVMAEARNEWQQYAPVEQAVAKDLQARFRAALDALHAHLEAEYTRNVEAKRAIVARAAELAGLEDTRQAIDEAKNLQRTWKTVGITPRHQDNALWEEFRKNCDAVFQRSHQEHAAFGAALEANQARAVALCEEMERVAGLTDEALLEGTQQAQQWRNEFESLELPRASARDLRQRFSRANGLCMDALRRHRAAEAREGWTRLFSAAAHVRTYALATAKGAAPEEREAFQASAASAVANLAHAPKGTRALLEQQLTRIDGGDISTDLAANESALRLLCVRAELIAEVETPAEDIELRREYQMQRLVQSMQRGERVTPAELDDLLLEWLVAGPVEPATHDALFARFDRCRAAREH